jgi:hypothetical protein
VVMGRPRKPPALAGFWLAGKSIYLLVSQP